MLTNLDLGNSDIGDKGAASLAAALEKNSTLTSIHLGYNNIGDEGAAILAAALETNLTLTSVTLTFDNIRDEGAASMATALEKNYALEVMQFDCPPRMQDEVNHSLARNIARYRQWRSSVMCWMWASNHLHERLPRDIVRIIGKMIWKSRTSYESPSIGGGRLASSTDP